MRLCHTVTGCFDPLKPWHPTVVGPQWRWCFSHCVLWDFHSLISRSCHIQHEVFSAVLTGLNRVVPQIPIVLSIVQTERTGNNRYPYSTGNNQVFQLRSWQVSFSYQYFELFRSRASLQLSPHDTDDFLVFCRPQNYSLQYLRRNAKKPVIWTTV